MAAIYNYLTSLDKTELVVHATVAFAAMFGVQRVLGSDGKQKLLEQRKKMQSVVIGSANEGEGPIHRNPEFVKELLETVEGWKTLHELFEAVVKIHGNNPCLGHRPKQGDKVGDYVWETYSAIAQRRINLGSGIINLIGHRKDETVGIYSVNRPEWVISDLACGAFRWVSVALYDTLGQNAVEFILKHAELKIVICAGKQLTTLLNVASNCPLLKTIIVMDPVSSEQQEAAKAKGIRILGFKEVEEAGAKQVQPFIPPFPEHIYTIMYTSGTTGDPKGVILTHANAVSEIAGVMTHEKDLFNANDVHMSYLPFAHSFERAAGYTILANGARIGFYQGNINELFNDIATLRPTFLLGAPRVWSRLYDKLIMIVNSGGAVKKALFHYGFAAKKKALENGGSTAIWDKILFSKTKARLGGRVRWIMSGSAPLDPKLGEFLKICFCCSVIEGYGLTENFAGAMVTHLNETQLGHVGRPLGCNEVKLQDIPEMNYSSAANNSGEVMIRGPNVFKGYYKDPEKTKEALESDGWFHTGDVGRWNPNGTLSIIDRKKNIFKLAQGEYVAVEYLEQVFVRSPFIQQVWVYGSSYKRYLCAVVVPDADYLQVWAKQNPELAQNKTDLASLVKIEKLNSIILKDMERVGKEAQLNGFEFIKSITLSSELFSTDNDMLTPTFKLRRVNLLKTYQKDIDTMYTKIGE